MHAQHYLRLWTESSGTTISKVVDLDKNKLLVTTTTSWRHLCSVKLGSRSSSEDRKVAADWPTERKNQEIRATHRVNEATAIHSVLGQRPQEELMPS